MSTKYRLTKSEMSARQYYELTIDPFLILYSSRDLDSAQQCWRTGPAMRQQQNWMMGIRRKAFLIVLRELTSNRYCIGSSSISSDVNRSDFFDSISFRRCGRCFIAAVTVVE